MKKLFFLIFILTLSNSFSKDVSTLSGNVKDFISEKSLSKTKIEVYKYIVDKLPDGTTNIHSSKEANLLYETYSDSNGNFLIKVDVISDIDYVFLKFSLNGYLIKYQNLIHVIKNEKNIYTVELEKTNPTITEKKIMSDKYEKEFIEINNQKKNAQSIEKDDLKNNPNNTNQRISSCTYTVPNQVFVTNLYIGYNNSACSNSGFFTGFINFDDYIAGNVSAEMSGFPLEAKKVQAVSGRTYSLYNINILGKSANCGQAYNTSANQVSIDAANTTTTQVLLYNGNLLQALYSARCNGNYTQNSNQGTFNPQSNCNLSGNLLPYLVSVSCSGHTNCNSNPGETPCCNVLISTANTNGYIYGHGVGMCQRGTQGFVSQGQTYDWILYHYYTGSCIANSGTSTCTDNFESNNSSSTATDVFANPLNSSNSSNYSLQGNIGYAGDQDWFKIKIAACGTLTLNLSSLPQNYDLELYGANGLSQFINGSYNSSTQNEQIIYTSTSATSTYVFAKVYPNNASDFTTASCYNLQFLWSPTTCPTSCTAPSNVNISNTTQTSVLVSWTAPVGTSSTYLRYRALSSGSFTQVDVTGLTSYTIPNLTCATNYEEYLISNCNSGGTQSTSTQSFSTSSCNNCTYSLSSNSANFPYSGGNGSFTINATAGNGCNWAVNTGSTSGCSLTNITSISSGTGPYTITYSVDFNPTNNPLTCTLTVTGNNGYSQDYVVNIAANTTCDPTFSQSSINLPNTSGGGSFTVNTGNGCYWNVSNSGCGFVNFSPSSGYGTTVINYTYTANTSTSSRTCRISLQQNTRSINLIQAGTQPSCTVPINLQSNPSQTSATVSWTNGTGTNYYKIRYKKTSDINFLESVLLTSNSTSYQINGLNCNTSYDWYIYDSCSNGSILVIPSSIPATFTTTACPTCTTTPSIPNSLTTGYPSSNNIGLSWAGSVVGFNNFDIERATSASGPFNHIAYVAPPSTTYNDPNIVAGITYYYRVRACCDNNCSAYSNISSATACVWRTRATSVSISNDTICLGNSVILTAIGGNLGTGDVWTWYLNGGFSIGSGSPITFTPTTSGTYCVKPDGGCVNQPNVSVTCKDFTVTNCVVTCNSISNGTTSNITSNSATINWNKDLSIATNNQIIEYKPLTSSTWLTNTLANNAITTILNSLACSINYQYRVIATCTNGSKDTVAGTFTTLTCPTNICDTLPKINVIPATCNLYTSNISGVSYQWQSNGNNVGTNSRFYTASGGNTIYTVTISNGTQTCTSPDYIFNCTITGVQNNVLTDSYSIFPNPTKNSVFIQSKSNSNLKISISLTNIIGQEVQQKVITNTNQFELSLKNLPVGIYILNISDDKGSGSMKIFKE